MSEQSLNLRKREKKSSDSIKDFNLTNKGPEVCLLK